MKSAKSVVNHRRKKIMQEIQNRGYINVDELVKLFDVSPVTIRRDLQYWEDLGAIEKNYGGARLIQQFVDYDNIEESNEIYKRAIAQYAATFVEDDDTIFINTSSTALLMINYITKKNVTVITNNGKALLLDPRPNVSICLTGGELRNPKESMVGPLAMNNLKRISAHKAFLGCNGFSLEAGLTTAIIGEVEINELMINKCSGSVFLLADHTKIGFSHSFSSCNANQVQHLITDSKANKEYIEALKGLGIDVFQVDPINFR